MFVEYMWKEVLPVLDQIEAALNESSTQGAHILDLLKIIAELTPHAGNLEDVPGKVLVVYERLLVSHGRFVLSRGCHENRASDSYKKLKGIYSR